MGGPRAKLNWLCFLAAKRHRNIHIYFIYKHIHQFFPHKIGFVFSNRVLLNTIISDFEFRISDFRAKPGELALFFQIASYETRIYTD